MDKWKIFFRKLLFPPVVLTILLTLISAIGLFYVFFHELDEHPVAYVVYLLSFYTLCVVSAGVPAVFRKSKRLVYSNRYAARYLTESDLRMRTSLYRGLVFNLFYAVMKLLASVYFHSIWLGAVSLYYMVLGICDFLLVRSERQSRRIQSETERLFHGWKSFRRSGWLLLAVNLAITGMVVQMIWQNKAYSYPGYLIYVMAAYTFYRITSVMIKTFRAGRMSDPVTAAVNRLDLCVALMSLFALQTAMFTSFGGEMSMDTQRLMNALTGGFVCLAVVCVAVFMIFYSHRIIRRMKKQNGFQ